MVIKNIQHFSDIERFKRDEHVDFTDGWDVTNSDLGDDKIVLSGLMYRLRNTEYLIAEGVYNYYDEESQDYIPDFDVSLLYESTHGLNLNEPLFFEQGTPASMFHSFVVLQVNHNLDSSAVLLEACVA